MSRAVVYKTLAEDPQLNAMGVAGIFPNYSLDGSPSRKKPFIIIRWEENTNRKFSRSRAPRIMNVHAHCPVEYSTDFGRIDRILERVKQILPPLEHVAGEDGYTLTSVQWTGDGSDFKDPGYETITRNASYEVLYRRTS